MCFLVKLGTRERCAGFGDRRERTASFMLWRSVLWARNYEAHGLSSVSDPQCWCGAVLSLPSSISCVISGGFSRSWTKCAALRWRHHLFLQTHLLIHIGVGQRLEWVLAHPHFTSSASSQLSFCLNYSNFWSDNRYSSYNCIRFNSFNKFLNFYHP